jgi:predicted RNA-binding Zn-ribbon protein involved in translation (DUF1610 family)
MTSSEEPERCPTCGLPLWPEEAAAGVAHECPQAFQLSAEEVERRSDELGICRGCGSDLGDELLRYSIDYCEACAGLPHVRQP